MTDAGHEPVLTTTEATQPKAGDTRDRMYARSDGEKREEKGEEKRRKEQADHWWGYDETGRHQY